MAVGQVGFRDGKKVHDTARKPVVLRPPYAFLHSPSLTHGSPGPFPRQVKKLLVPTRQNAIVNRLNKTRREVTNPDLRAEKEDHLRQARQREQAKTQERKKEEQRLARERKELARLKERNRYEELFDEESVARSSNWEREEGWEEDFM